MFLILSASRRPSVRVVLFKGTPKISLLVYIWELTHGDSRTRMNFGFRNRREPNEIREGGKPLLGWSDDLNVFAGFDATSITIPCQGGLRPSN